MELLAGARVQPPSLARLSEVGWDHRGAPLELLERVSLSRRERPAFLEAVAAAGSTDVVVRGPGSATSTR